MSESKFTPGPLDNAAKVLEAIAGLLQSYPRPSSDPNGRTLLDALELAKAGAREARAKVDA